MPVIIIGYAMLTQGISARTLQRAITDVIARPGESVTSGDLVQLVSRAGGTTSQVRPAFCSAHKAGDKKLDFSCSSFRTVPAYAHDPCISLGPCTLRLHHDPLPAS